MKKLFLLFTIFLSFPIFTASRKRKTPAEETVTISNGSSNHEKQVLEEYLIENDITDDTSFMFGTHKNPVAWTLTQDEYDEAEETLQQKKDKEKRTGDKVINIDSTVRDKIVFTQFLLNKKLLQKPGPIFGKPKNRVAWKLSKEEFENVVDFLNQDSDDEEAEINLQKPDKDDQKETENELNLEQVD